MYYVYMLTNRNNKVLYTGVTNNMERRIYEHRNGMGGVFTKKYNVNKLVYVDSTSDIKAAIRREKQIKSWSRKKKDELVESMNPEWRDLLPDAGVSSVFEAE